MLSKPEYFGCFNCLERILLVSFGETCSDRSSLIECAFASEWLLFFAFDFPIVLQRNVQIFIELAYSLHYDDSQHSSKLIDHMRI